MNTMPNGTYRPFHKLHLLGLLAGLVNRSASGCFQITSGGNFWFLYLEQGKLIYASDLVDPFGRLDRYLRQIGEQTPNLSSAVRVQLRLMFETPTVEQPVRNSDYRAICWLVKQQHLTIEQTKTLIAALSKDVIEAFLPIQTGSYTFLEHNRLAELPRFCRLDLLAMLQRYQNQFRRQAGPISFESYSTVEQSLPSFRSVANKLVFQPSNGIQQSSSAITTTTPLSNRLQKQEHQPPPTQSPTEKIAAPTYKIACIDDSPAVLQSINSFLDDNSFSVLLISNPIKALMQIIRSKPDLILLDITMPSLDGYELCSLLRKHPNFKRTPVIMVTSNTGFIDRAKAKLVGASGYLTKPFNQTDLIKTIFKYLS